MAKTIVTNAVLKINGQEVENSFNKVNGAVRKLHSDLKKLEVGTEEWVKKAAELKTAKSHFENVKNEINAVTNSLEKSGGFWNKLTSEISKFGNIVNGIFTANLIGGFFDAVGGKIAKTTEELLKIADAMSDVQKTTGMTLDQVKELWDAFDEMDTRTSKLDRLKIAEVGGRLGVPIAQMKGFVQEIDKAYVALGDSFEGGLEGVVNDLGKIKNLFEDTKGMTYAESINRVGSALNTLAAQGTASEGNISQFALRVGTLPDALKPAVDKVLGLGAAFEESGIDAQIAASGFSNFITSAGENIGGFAYSMNMGVEQARELLNTNPEEFFLRFAEGMKGLSATDTANILKSLKLESLEVQKVVGAAANNTDKFRDSMQTAGVEMGKMTSLQNEFNTKNNNAPAILEKLKNAISDIFTKSNAINLFEGLIKAIGWITGVTNEAGNGVIVFKERLLFLVKIIATLIVSIGGYNVAMALLALTTKNAYQQTLLYNIIQKAKIAWDTIARGVTLLYAAAKATLEGNTVRATVAMRLFNIVTKANPIGLLVAVLSAAVTAYLLFSKEADKASQKQKLMNDITTESNKNIVSQKNELENLLKVARDETASKEARLSAIKRLNEISPEYLGNLTLENINTKNATDAVNAYTEALYRSSRARVLQQKMDKAVEKVEDIKTEKVGQDWLSKVTGGKMTLVGSDFKNLDPNMLKQREKWAKEHGDKYANEMMEAASYYYEKRNKKINDANQEVQMYQNELVGMMKKDISTIGNNVPSNKEVPGSQHKNRPVKNPTNNKKNPDKPKKDKSKEDIQNSLDAEKEAYYKSLEAELQYRSDKLNLIQNSYQKEKDLADLERSKELAAQRKEQDEILATIADIEAKKKDAKTPEAKNNYETALAKQRELLRTHDQIIITSEETHQLKLKTIREKWAISELEEKARLSQQKIDQDRTDREREINNISTMEDAKLALSEMKHLKLTDQELAGIKTLEDAKRALREDADRAALAQMQASVTAQIKGLKTALADPAISQEARDKLNQDLDALQQKLEGIRGQKGANEAGDEKKVVDESNEAKGKIDILGFSAKDWEESFKNLDTTQGKIKAAQMAVQALSNAFQMFSQLQQNLNNKEMNTFSKLQNKKKKELLKQLNEGYINQEEYNTKLQQLDAETANKKADLEYKQAKMQKTVAIASAIANTALGVVAALTMMPWTPANYALAAAVGILGAIQIATISAQPLPERPSFAAGGFTPDISGRPDETGEIPTGYYKLHRKEWVAPRWMVEEPRTAAVINYLEGVRTGRAKPMAEGGFPEDAKTNTINNPAISQDMSPYISVLGDVKKLLQMLYDDGVIAKWTDDAETGKRVKSAIKKFENIETRASGK